MALSNLTLSFTQTNDTKALIIQDTTSIDESTDWGFGGNINYTDIGDQPGEYSLTLEVSITTPGETTLTQYDNIDLFNEFGPFTDYEDMKFTITADMLKSSGSSQFTSSDSIPDGIWSFTYRVNTVTGGTLVASTSYDILVNGSVKKKLYEKYSKMTTAYTCDSVYKNREIMETVTVSTWYLALFADSYVSKDEELLSKMNTLNNLLTNGSNCTW